MLISRLRPHFPFWRCPMPEDFASARVAVFGDQLPAHSASLGNSPKPETRSGQVETGSGIALPLFIDSPLESAARHGPVFIDGGPQSCTLGSGSFDAVRGVTSRGSPQRIHAMEVLVMLAFVPWLLAATVGFAPSSEEILARVAATTGKRHSIDYSCLREYKLQNARYSKTAAVQVRMTHSAGEGKHFTVLASSGFAKLTAVVEKLLATETESSRAEGRAAHEIGPANYQGLARGMTTIAGRTCYVLDITPKYKSRYLIVGTLYVDAESFGIVRLEGSTSARVSMWVGSPHITEEFSEIAGVWLPSHIRSVSSNMLLGTTELEIHHSEYEIKERDRTVRAATGN